MKKVLYTLFLLMVSCIIVNAQPNSDFSRREVFEIFYLQHADAYVIVSIFGNNNNYRNQNNNNSWGNNSRDSRRYQDNNGSRFDNSRDFSFNTDRNSKFDSRDNKFDRQRYPYSGSREMQQKYDRSQRLYRR